MDVNKIDLSELRAIWARRREAAAEVRARSDPAGMTRPPRDPDERAFLEERGLLGPFVEKEEPGWREWIEKRYTRPGSDAK